ncbi:ABC transporter ATP-binding protein [Verrucomicrobiaceae bacterium N1E253]|uniref:ABC transporter ATP-binding protein n=1 Tax=Oceaniferula marina TaxID=2748318 RepID=A0A851GR14_9BACT|nr:ABC transporter ATP-binding protein [Oceaniferula marina]NWK56634.1 ABC transporter ATP-binding protein [Oceaniferula marina]
MLALWMAWCCIACVSEMVIDIQETKKRYRGGVEALRGVSLQVPRGCIFGLLGPNGAGKSTLVKILMSIVRASQCSGTMLGQRIGHKATLGKVGYLPEHARFPEYLKGGEVIRYVAGLCGVPHGLAKQRAEGLLEMVGMKEWGERKMGTYSKGMKQRIGLAQALVNDPEIVFLDEPTDGVDPTGRLEMRNMLKSMRDEGRTVFVNSHLLGELEMICDRVAILDNGQIVRHGTIEELTAKSCRYEIRFDGQLSLDLQAKLKSEGARIDAGTIEVYQNDPAAMQPVIDVLRAEGVVIIEMREARQSLEELFMESVTNTGAGAQLPPTIPAQPGRTMPQ